MTVKVKVQDFPKVFKKYSEDLGEEMKNIVAEEVVAAIPRLVEKSPVDTGQYAASWMFTPSEHKIILGNHAPHSESIEFGARPHKPPIKPLLAWAKRVLKDPSQPPEYSRQVWGLALGVQKKIEERGQDPKHILTKEIPIIIDGIKKRARDFDPDPPLKGKYPKDHYEQPQGQ